LPVRFDSGTDVDNQQFANEDSQRDSQDPFSTLDADLQKVIAAWEKLPAGLKSAVMAAVSSNQAGE
jgi:hypothetical protein